ncbi:hypothetical protein SCWH03_33920 [Streptomyces pacificus]|uniref:Uncharacterized protein n=1 Tax=Streptomyces pacificus TaxID=2705029 RepID=A0A6A0AWZ1_9ACTN|nr:hypothetical protein SCWH03_33920 [Streptomyces pacificus]
MRADMGGYGVDAGWMRERTTGCPEVSLPGRTRSPCHPVWRRARSAGRSSARCTVIPPSVSIAGTLPVRNAEGQTPKDNGQPGLMLWFSRNTLSGSWTAFTPASRR